MEKGAEDIYLDAVWLLNFLMDAMILNLTLGITRAKSTKFRFWMATTIASLIVPLTIFYPDSWLTSSLGKIVLSFVIIWVAFSYASIRQFFMQWFSFYFVTFAIGGAMLGIHFFLTTEIDIQGGTIVTFSGGYGDPVSWLFVCVGFPCSYLFTRWRMNTVAVHRIKLDNIYRVVMEWAGETVECQGMVDSGNQLVDPVSRKMVFLADETVMKQFLSVDVLKDLEMDQVISSMEDLPEHVQSALRLVPFQAAGSAGQLLVTVMIDSISIDTPEGMLTIRQPLVGLQHHDLTHDGSYHILIHPHVMVKGQTA